MDTGDQLEYSAPEDLGIKLQRIVDDTTDLSKRVGEFSYPISLIKSKNNSRIFEFPDVKGRRNIFVGKQFGCKIIYNSRVLLDGILELVEYDSKNFKVVLYSKFTELLDDIGTKKLSQLTALPTIVWDYEKTIVNHIRAGYKNSDETTHQFPFSFYQTPFMSGATTDLSGKNPESFLGFKYNYFTPHLSFSTINPVYYGQLPPALYLVHVVKGIISDAGWTLAGNFFERPEIKKQIIPFCGKQESYASAIITGSTNYLNLNLLLPSVNQIDFLKGVINFYDLYFSVNTVSKTIIFETYTQLFGDSLNPHDITSKVDLDSVDVTRLDLPTKISFNDDQDNGLIAGYDRPIQASTSYATENAIDWLNRNNPIRSSLLDDITDTYPNSTFKEFFNKTDGDKEIALNISYPNYFCYAIYNNVSISGTTWSNARGPLHNISIPLLSTQTPTDYKDHLFCPDDPGTTGSTNLTSAAGGNLLADMEFEGGIKIYYYYGGFAYDGIITGTGSTKQSDWCWLAIATGGTGVHPTFAKVHIPIASPFKLITVAEKNNLLSLLQSGQINRFSLAGVEAQYLLMTYYSAGKTSGTYDTTPYSLTLSDDQSLIYENVYSTFHKPKYDLLNSSAQTKVNMLMTANDWNEMQINRTLKFNDELYRLIKLSNYDPIKRTCEVYMLKK